MTDMWAKQLPRLYDLYTHSEREHLDNYFYNFNDVLNRGLSELRQKAYADIETSLSRLSQNAWMQLRQKALPYVSSPDRKKNRAWGQLFDTLNESLGYNLLLERGYSDIVFIDSINKAPDLKGVKFDDVALVEIKTINRSDNDLAYYKNPPLARHSAYKVTPLMKDKLRSTLSVAKEQLMTYTDATVVHRIALLLIRLDTDTRVNENIIKDLQLIEKEAVGYEAILKVIFSM